MTQWHIEYIYIYVYIYIYICIQSKVGGNDTVNNPFERISPSGDCQGSVSTTDTPSSTRQSPRRTHTVPHYYIAMKRVCVCGGGGGGGGGGVSVITHVYPNVGVHDNNSLRPQQRVHHLQAIFQKRSRMKIVVTCLKSSESNQESN